MICYSSFFNLDDINLLVQCTGESEYVKKVQAKKILQFDEFLLIILIFFEICFGKIEKNNCENNLFDFTCFLGMSFIKFSVPM